VQARTREIGTLRALGFSSASIAVSFLLEASLMALCGFALGSALAWLGALAVAASVGDVGALDLTAAFALAVAIGIGGALPPAWRAARLRPIEALRKG
jgi:ABC-type antimicrobial peptide transport system permease subunit